MRQFTGSMISIAGVTALLSTVLGLSQQSSQLVTAASSAPTEPRAAKLFAKAAKEYADGKLAPALEDFRKADQQTGGHCLACEWKALTLAQQMQEYTTAHEEAALLMDHVSTPEEKAQVHMLAGDVCMAEGGYRIFEKPFQDANKEFEAALAVNPGQPTCLYKDGLALAHLHQYDKAKERFEA